MAKNIALDTVIQELDGIIKNKALSYFSSTSLVETTETAPTVWKAKLTSGGEVIEADIVLDDPGKEVLFYRCDCKRNQICEHVAAALMVIKAKLNTQSKTPQGQNPNPKSIDSSLANMPIFVSTQVEALYKTYKELPLSEARIVKILALVYETVNLNNIQLVYETAFMSQNHKLKTTEAKTW